MIVRGHALHLPLKDHSVQCVVTSPPYWGLRDYQTEGQFGLEATPREYVDTMVQVFREVWRVLKDDGTLWLNLGDSYAGSWGAQSRPNGNDLKSTLEGGSPLSARQILAHPKETGTGSLKHTPGLKVKDLIGLPWRVAFALQEDGWYLRQDVIWAKPNPMPESVKDRCTKAHEYLFLLSKNERYYFDQEAIKEPRVAGDRGSSFVSEQDMATKRGLGKGPRSVRVPAGWKTGAGSHGTIHAEGREQTVSYVDDTFTRRNKRSVWTIPTQAYPEAHFATFPEKLVEPCLLAGSRRGDLVLDPFAGSGTTLKVATLHGRHGVGIELNPAYCRLAHARCTQLTPTLF